MDISPKESSNVVFIVELFCLQDKIKNSGYRKSAIFINGEKITINGFN